MKHVLDFYMILCLILFHPIQQNAIQNQTTIQPTEIEKIFDFVPYYCGRSHEQVSRILMTGSWFFIVFQTRIVKFSIPIIKYGNYSEDERGKFYLISLPEMTFADEDEPTFPIIGYNSIFLENASFWCVFELQGNSYNYYRVKLNFDDIPGKRLYAETILIKGDGDFHYRIDHESNLVGYFLVKYNGYKMQVLHSLIPQSMNYSDEIRYFSNESITTIQEQRYDYIVESAAMISMSNEMSVIIELDREQVLHFKIFPSSGHLSIKDWPNWSILLSSLLSCHQKFMNSNQIKGIHYNKKTKVFYIFIERYYLKIESTHLFENNFAIHDDAYERARDIKFTGSRDELANIRLIGPNMNYVHCVGTNFYFKTFRQVFEPIYDQYYDFELKKNDNRMINKIFDNCQHILFQFDKYIFCLEQNLYYLIGISNNTITYFRETIKNKNHINDLFDEDDLKFEFVFEYINQIFVFMTSDYLYLVDFKHLNINQNTGKMTFTNSSTQIKKFKNCLFPIRRNNLDCIEYHIILWISIKAVLYLICVLYIVFHICRIRKRILESDLGQGLISDQLKTMKAECPKIDKLPTTSMIAFSMIAAPAEAELTTKDVQIKSELMPYIPIMKTISNLYQSLISSSRQIKSKVTPGKFSLDASKLPSNQNKQSLISEQSPTSLTTIDSNSQKKQTSTSNLLSIISKNTTSFLSRESSVPENGSLSSKPSFISRKLTSEPESMIKKSSQSTTYSKSKISRFSEEDQKLKKRSIEEKNNFSSVPEKPIVLSKLSSTNEFVKNFSPNSKSQTFKISKEDKNLKKESLKEIKTNSTLSLKSENFSLKNSTKIDSLKLKTKR